MSMLKAPNVTEGEWIVDRLGVASASIRVKGGGRRRIARCSHTGLYENESLDGENAANAKMLAASKKLAEALASIIDGGLLDCYDSPEFRGNGNCAYCKSIAALLAAGYTESK